MLEEKLKDGQLIFFYIHVYISYVSISWLVCLFVRLASAHQVSAEQGGGGGGGQPRLTLPEPYGKSYISMDKVTRVGEMQAEMNP